MLKAEPASGYLSNVSAPPIVGVRWSVLVRMSASGNFLKKGMGSRSHITSTSEIITCRTEHWCWYVTTCSTCQEYSANNDSQDRPRRAAGPCWYAVSSQHNCFPCKAGCSCRAANPSYAAATGYTVTSVAPAAAARLLAVEPTCTSSLRNSEIKLIFLRPILANVGEPQPKSPVVSPGCPAQTDTAHTLAISWR